MGIGKDKNKDSRDKKEHRKEREGEITMANWKYVLGITYNVKSLCENCNEQTIIRVPKGTYVYDFLDERECKCDYCGCRITEVVSDSVNPSELKKKHERKLSSLKEKVRLRSEE